MLHAAPTSETKANTAQSKTQVVPQPERELHPHLLNSTGLYSPDGMSGTASGVSPDAQRRQALAGMQSTRGNQAVLRMLHGPQQAARMTPLRPSQGIMLQRKCACGGSSKAGGECAECNKQQEQENGPFQTKLRVSQPGDQYEQEADQVAEQVMRMTDTESPASEDEDETKSHLMRKQNSVPRASTATDLSGVPPIVHTVLSNGGGQPLDTTTRAFMEPRFGHDFSQVRVHTDERAAESAQAVNALAYTVGRNVVFGQGQYTTGTHEGQRLLAHELTHTIQQGADRAFNPAVQRMRLLDAGGGLIQRDTDASTTSSDSGASTSPSVPAAPSMDEQYNTALQAARKTGNNWPDAAEKLNAFNHEDIQLRLAQLTADEIGYLHQGALDNPRVGPQSQVAQLTEPRTPLASTAPPIASQAPSTLAAAPTNAPAPTTAHENCTSKPISDMTDFEKLGEAYDRADIGAAVREKISSLISPKALVLAILAFMLLFTLSQFTPVGWAADLGIALTVIFIGTALISAIKHLVNFADARNATTCQQLDQAGAEFAQAVAKVGVDAIILIVTHGFGSGSPEGGVPYEGPPPTQLAFATARGGKSLVAVAANTISAETAAQLGLKAAGSSLVMMSQSSGSGPGPGSRTRDFEPPVLDHKTEDGIGDLIAGGELPKSGAERNLAIESWTPQELKEVEETLEQSIPSRQAEQRRLGETSVGPEDQPKGAQHRERIEQEIDLLRAIQKKLSGT